MCQWQTIDSDLLACNGCSHANAVSEPANRVHGLLRPLRAYGTFRQSPVAVTAFEPNECDWSKVVEVTVFLQCMSPVRVEEVRLPAVSSLLGLSGVAG